MAERTAPPSPTGMDRGSAEYRAAVRAAVAGAPPIDAETKHLLRAIFTSAPAAEHAAVAS